MNWTDKTMQAQCWICPICFDDHKRNEDRAFCKTEDLIKLKQEHDKLKARNEEIDTWDVTGCMLLLKVAKRIVSYKAAILAGEWEENSSFMIQLIDDCEKALVTLNSPDETILNKESK